MHPDEKQKAPGRLQEFGLERPAAALLKGRSLWFPACRIAFYLAQTLMVLGHHQEAFRAYEERVAMKGWHVRVLKP